MERKIGEVFMTSKGKVKVVEQDTCRNCAFDVNNTRGDSGDSCASVRDNIGMCSYNSRTDRASVIFALETEELSEQIQEKKLVQADRIDAEGFPIRMSESVFQYEDKYLKVVTSDNTCAGCYFANIECSGDRIRHIRGQCRKNRRDTPEGIIFKEVPKPIESQSISSEFPIDEPCATERPIGSKFMTSKYGLLQVVGRNRMFSVCL